MRPGSLRLLNQIDAAVVEGRLWNGEGATLLAGAAAANGVELVVAGAPPARGRRPLDVGPDGVRVVAAAEAAGEIRRLQTAGRVVATIGGRSFAALANGDLPIGVAGADGRSPDGSHVLCRTGLADAARVIAATGPARQASRESAGLSLAGAIAGAIVAMAPPLGPRRPRVLMAIDAAALAAVGNAVRHAHHATVAPLGPSSRTVTDVAAVRLPASAAAGNGGCAT
jgi:cation-transporting ATPase I